MKNSRISSLDGIRAISIALVLLAHTNGTRGFAAWRPGSVVGDLGHLGVTVFFVISGYLITTLLINEFNASGTISLKDFYARRALRILPAAYAYLLVMAVATWLSWIDVRRVDLLAAATYLANYDAHRSWYVGHLWSLAVEEQFYLLWPLLFVWLGQRRALFAALVAFLAAPVVRASMHLLIPLGPYRDLEIFPAVADGIAIGCVFAILRPRLLLQHWYLKITASAAIWLLLPLIIIINRFNTYTVIDFLGSPLQLLAIVTLIEAGTRHAATYAGRLLNSAPMVFIGTLSYSLYLWQQPFLNRHADSWLTAFPVNLSLAVAAALLSYYLVERPFLRMRRRYKAPTTATASTELPELPLKT
jgi:peptidoglycan/LPS O-acetylase OafA/YrhL